MWFNQWHLSRHGGIGLEFPGGNKLKENILFWKLRTQKKDDPLPLRKNQEFTRHKGDIKHF